MDVIRDKEFYFWFAVHQCLISAYVLLAFLSKYCRKKIHEPLFTLLYLPCGYHAE